MNMMVLSAELGGAFSIERWSYAGKMTLLGMLMIFSVLGVLWGVLSLFKIIFAGKSPKKEKNDKKETPSGEAKAAVVTPAPSAPVAEPQDDLALIAVLTAAVSAYREAEGENGDFRVVSFRRTSNGRAWNSKK